MLGVLTQKQMEETRSEYAGFLERVQQAVKEGILTPEDSKHFTPYAEELDNYIIKHEDGVYEYQNWYASNRETYSWELDEYTFTKEARECMTNRMEAMDRGEDSRAFEFPAIWEDYGTCDSFDQVWEAYPQLLTDPRHFILRVRKVHKKDQSPQQGWRWEKHGKYLGNRSEGYEYLYDEPNIDFVWQFDIIQIKQG
ncbi:MAG: hypothetical protein H9W81_16495 [Enterococcus sp.]|nr:hypothetical protein [Enterococcus sp.]